MQNYAKSVATEILRQLGGNRFIVMTGKIHEHARIYRLRSVAGSQILNFMS